MNCSFAVSLPLVRPWLSRAVEAGCVAGIRVVLGIVVRGFLGLAVLFDRADDDLLDRV
jgi:hypothetical protein